jgi:hypothetical protein
LGQIGDLGLELLLTGRGPHRPVAVNPALPASRNCRRFQKPTDCSDTFARRAARRPDSSPARIDITIRVFSSADTAGGLDMMIGLLDGQTARNGPCQKV